MHENARLRNMIKELPGERLSSYDSRLPSLCTSDRSTTPNNILGAFCMRHENLGDGVVDVDEDEDHEDAAIEAGEEEDDDDDDNYEGMGYFASYSKSSSSVFAAAGSDTSCGTCNALSPRGGRRRSRGICSLTGSDMAPGSLNSARVSTPSRESTSTFTYRLLFTGPPSSPSSVSDPTPQTDVLEFVAKIGPSNVAGNTEASSQIDTYWKR